MNINLINNLDQAYGLNKSNKNKSSDNKDDIKNNDKKLSSKSDSLEISSDVHKINEIKSRINSNFYNNSEVINEVAKRLIDFSEI